MDLKVTPFDGLPEIFFQLQALQGLNMHARVEYLVGCLGFLGLVHSQIRVAQEAGRLHGGAAQCDPYTSGLVDLASRNDKGLIQLLRDTLRDANRVAYSGDVIHQDDELVSTEACSRISGSQALLYALAHLDQ
jgi:hypothetical protein